MAHFAFTIGAPVGLVLLIGISAPSLPTSGLKVNDRSHVCVIGASAFCRRVHYLGCLSPENRIAKANFAVTIGAPVSLVLLIAFNARSLSTSGLNVYHRSQGCVSCGSAVVGECIILAV